MASTRRRCLGTPCTRTRARRRQGLTLVHFSAQLEPCLSLNLTKSTQHIPQEVLTLSRKVDERKPLGGGGLSAGGARGGRGGARLPQWALCDAAADGGEVSGVRRRDAGHGQEAAQRGRRRVGGWWGLVPYLIQRALQSFVLDTT